MKKQLIILLSLLVLVACSYEKPKSTKPAATKEVQTEEKEIEEEPKTEEKEIVVEEEPEESGAAKDYAYTSAMSDYMGELRNVNSKLSDKILEVLNDPSLRSDSEWMADTMVTLSYFEDIIIDIRSLEPPDNEFLKQAHESNMKATDEYFYIIDNFIYAIVPGNKALFDKIMDSYEAATGHLKNANRYITEYNNSLKEG